MNGFKYILNILDMKSYTGNLTQEIFSIIQILNKYGA